jgi:hypothetical protein
MAGNKAERLAASNAFWASLPSGGQFDRWYLAATAEMLDEEFRLLQRDYDALIAPLSGSKLR